MFHIQLEAFNSLKKIQEPPELKIMVQVERQENSIYYT